MRARLLVLLLTLIAATGCVVKDELKDGLREMRSQMAESRLETHLDGSGELYFKFQYGIALVDEDGVEPFPWEYRLLDSQRNVLASNAQDMRKPEPDKTKVLVTGERERRLEVPAGQLEVGRTYVLWIVIRYREEILHELLWPVTASPAG